MYNYFEEYTTWASFFVPKILSEQENGKQIGGARGIASIAIAAMHFKVSYRRELPHIAIGR